MSFEMKWDKDKFMKDLEKQAIEVGMKGAEEDVRRDLAALRCPVHGKTPRVVSSRIVGNRLSMQITSCCDEMQQKAERVAAGQG